MSTARGELPVDEATDSGNGVAGFAAAVVRRIDRRVVTLALLILLVAQVAIRLGKLGLTHLGDQLVTLPSTNWKFLLLMQAMFIASLTLGALLADEAVARGANRWPTYLAALVVASAFAAWANNAINQRLGWAEVLLDGVPMRPDAWREASFFFAALLFGGFGYSVYVNQRTSRLAAARMRKAELARALARRRTLESRLQAMQARVEPQFLFNTLAQVGELFERDPAIAGGMLDDLILYLRAALPHLRESTSTLERELDLARAYLDIMRVRLGNRLQFTIDVPDEVRSARMPAMMLLPLIDHALVYGLQPAEGDGELRIVTTASDGRLRLAVTDSGAGFLPEDPGSGLASIAERLQALYGTDARFELERMHERGTRATLEIPYEVTDLRDR